jgi:hypothetical protein
VAGALPSMPQEEFGSLVSGGRADRCAAGGPLYTDSSAGRTPLEDVVADDPEPDQQPASMGCHLELMSSMISTVEAGYGARAWAG